MTQAINLISVIASVAYRDIVKYAKDRLRLVFSMIFPVVFIGVLGGSLSANLGEDTVGFDFLTFVLVGVIAQTLFQTVTQGVISLIDDREKSLTQEFYVAPIPRWSIVLGKIIGESFVALLQGLFIIGFGLIIGVTITWMQFLLLIPVMLGVGLFGGAFGIFVVSLVDDQQSANRLFPLIIFPQFFLAGVFSPIKELPLILLIASRIVPLTYAVDFTRSIFYLGTDVYDRVVIYNPVVNLIIIGIYFWVFLILGSYLSARQERNK
jgi:ABC-2 type transport system permease protein